VSLSRDQPFVPIMAPIGRFTDGKYQQDRSFSPERLLFRQQLGR
jgi:hypothetical protein